MDKQHTPPKSGHLLADKATLAMREEVDREFDEIDEMKVSAARMLTKYKELETPNGVAWTAEIGAKGKYGIIWNEGRGGDTRYDCALDMRQHPVCSVLRKMTEWDLCEIIDLAESYGKL